MLLQKGILRNIRLMYVYRGLSKSYIYLPIQIIYFAQITGSYAKAMSVIALGNIVSSNIRVAELLRLKILTKLRLLR